MSTNQPNPNPNPTNPPTAIGLTAQGVIVMDGQSAATMVSAANQAAIANYTNVIVPNYLKAVSQTAPGMTPPTPPAQLMLTAFDQTAFDNALIAWNNVASSGKNPGNPNVAAAYSNNIPYPVDPRIVALSMPPATTPQPTDPVGVYLGNNQYAVLPGDTTPLYVPITSDSRGTMMKVPVPTDPFDQQNTNLAVYTRIG